jgi:hypothetical protein
MRVYKYVPLHLIEEYYEQGWFIASLLGPPHCFYSVIMQQIPLDEWLVS